MKLKVSKGELTLPKDFSFDIEQNSAFFSGDGASSVAATIPATPADQAKLGYPCRVGRKNRFINAFPASITSGVFSKTGVLVIADATEDSITCSMAIEDSEFYAQHKEKNLKELFANKVLTTYSDPADWSAWLYLVYKDQATSDFRLFPVAVDGKDGYQINNEPVYSAELYQTIWPLAHEARVIKEGDQEIGVPEGYGLAPFLKLWKFFEYIFTLCGYSVGENCFATDTNLSGLVLVHNCADVVCNGRIDYSDLVPNRTISQIIDWMNKKFHAQIIVHPAQKTVDIVLLEGILQGSHDLDLTGHVLGRPRYTYAASSRVVYQPNTSLEGAAPAAESLPALLKKYKYVLPVDEDEFNRIDNSCLVYRKATGEYYEVHWSFKNAGRGGVVPVMAYKPVPVGTNQFRYDRANADGQEEYSPEDLVPPMVSAGDPSILMPYIGGRKHRNTSLNGSDKDQDQDIIIVDYMGLGESAVSAHPISDGKVYLGTTQAYNNRGHVRQGAISLTPEDYVSNFFHLYNKHLLNNAISISCQPNLLIAQIMNYDLYALKMLDGQLLLPVSMRYEVGRSIRCQDAQFRLIKDYADGVDDGPIEIPAPIYKWQLVQSQIDTRKAQLQALYPSRTVLWKYDDSDPYVSGEKDVFLLSPQSLGELSVKIDRVIYFFARNGAHSPVDTYLETDTLQEWFVAVNI